MEALATETEARAWDEATGHRARDTAPRSETIDVDLMLFFHAVAEALSFTRAAKKLGIDQSWLSHKIRQFEDSIGSKLFVRNTRNVELTGAGRALLDPARRLAEVAEQARAATRMLHLAVGGVLRVGALPFSFRRQPAHSAARRVHESGTRCPIDRHQRHYTGADRSSA